jgi:hypothetical protein
MHPVKALMATAVIACTALAAPSAPDVHATPLVRVSDHPTCDSGSCWWYVKANQNTFTTEKPVGVQGWLTIERPVVQGQVQQGFHSLAAMYIATLQGVDPYDGVEVGWAVAPNVYTDEEPHLFASPVKATKQDPECWTTPTSCGWEPASGAKHVLGENLQPSYGSGETKPFMILKDKNGNWGLQYDNEMIGHFRGDYWGGRFTVGDQVSWYGEVETMGNHSPGCTQMGNGTFGPKPGAAKMGGLGYWTDNGGKNELTWAHPTEDTRYGNEEMYSMGDHLNASWFTYGGPGGFVDENGNTHPC